jgi:hypothetical protein
LWRPQHLLQAARNLDLLTDELENILIEEVSHAG